MIFSRAKCNNFRQASSGLSSLSTQQLCLCRIARSILGSSVMAVERDFAEGERAGRDRRIRERTAAESVRAESRRGFSCTPRTCPASRGREERRSMTQSSARGALGMLRTTSGQGRRMEGQDVTTAYGNLLLNFTTINATRAGVNESFYWGFPGKDSPYTTGQVSDPQRKPL